MRKISFLLLLRLLFLPFPASAAEDDALGGIAIFCPLKIFEPPVIDGKLDENCWRGASVYDNFLGEPWGAGDPVEVKDLGTSVRILQDEKNLYVAFDCPEPFINKVKAESLPKDEDGILSGDRVIVALDPRHNHEELYLFAVNAAGSRYDSFRRTGGKFEKEWNCDWKAVVSRRENGWSVEMGIPLSALPGAKDGSAGVNFIRHRTAGLTEKSATSLSWGSVYVPPYWGDLYFPPPSLYLKRVELKEEQDFPLLVTTFRKENFPGRFELKVECGYGDETISPGGESSVIGTGETEHPVFYRVAGRPFPPERIVLTVTEVESQRDLFSVSYPLRANAGVAGLLGEADQAAARLEKLKEAGPIEPAVTTTAGYLLERIYRLRPENRPSIFLRRKPEVALGRAREDLTELNAALDLAEKGKNPFAAKRGVFVRTYFSPVDRTWQPYRLYVPKNYDENKNGKYPLCLFLHGWFGTYRIEPFGFKNDYLDSEQREMFVAVLNGRGSLTFRQFAQTELFDVLDDIRKNYNIDPERVYVAGHSQGGMASFFLATRFPDRFAALVPESGAANQGFFENVIAPLSIHHGDQDSAAMVDWSRLAYLQLQRLGKAVEYHEYPGVEHAVWPAMEAQFDLPGWLLKQKRKPAPPEMTLVCDSQLRYNHSCWVAIDGLLRQAELGKVKARIIKKNVIEVKTENVSSLHLDLNDELVDTKRALTVIFNGKKKKFRPPLGRVALGEPVSGGLMKKPGLSGPIEDAYFERFLYVYGTAGREAEIALNKAEALKLCQWKNSVTEPPYLSLVRADGEITDEDIKNANLILIGTFRSNLITKKLVGMLPVQINEDAIVVGEKEFTGENLGIKMIYPNPLNPEKYVVIYTSSSREAMKDIDKVAGSDGPASLWRGDPEGWDIVVFDDRAKRDVGKQFVFMGDFDRRWQPEKDEEVAVFTGDPAALPALAADGVRAATGADLAIISSHIFVPAQKGSFTRSMLESNFPNHNVVSVKAKGADLTEMFRYWVRLPAEYTPPLVVSGFTLGPEGASPLEPEKEYTVAMEPVLAVLAPRYFGCRLAFELPENEIEIRKAVRERLKKLQEK